MSNEKDKVNWRLLQDKKPGVGDYNCTLILGAARHGKSTLIRAKIDEYLDAYKQRYEPPIYPRVLVHALSDSPAFKDLPDIGKLAKKAGVENPLDIIRCVDDYGRNPFWDKYPKMKFVVGEESKVRQLTECVAEHFRNGLSVWDEWTTYVKYNPPSWQINLGYNRGNYGQEVYYVCHLISKVPKIFAKSDKYRYIILFNTNEKLSEYDFEKWYYEDLMRKAYKHTQKPENLKKVDKYVQYHVLVDTHTEKMMEFLPMKGIYRPIS